MRLTCYHRDRPLNLSSSRRYRAEEVEGMVRSVLSQNQPVYVEYMEETVPVRSGDVPMAATLASLYHNSCVCVLPPSDGWEEETEAMEREAMRHMQSPSSEDSYEDDGSI